jgi:hypothetical protein
MGPWFVLHQLFWANLSENRGVERSVRVDIGEAICDALEKVRHGVNCRIVIHNVLSDRDGDLVRRL